MKPSFVCVVSVLLLAYALPAAQGRTVAIRSGSNRPVLSPAERAKSDRLVYANDSPASALTMLFDCIVTLEADTLDRLLADDYRFVSHEPEFSARYPRGWGRADELVVLRHLAHGGVNADGVALEPAESIAISNSGVEEVPNAASAEVAEHRRAFVVHRLHMIVRRRGAATLDAGPGEHTLVFERGDVAHAPPQQPRDDRHWYLVGWYEGLAPDSVISESAARPETTAAHTALAFVIRRLSGPREWPVVMELSLAENAPAHLSLFDVAGRAVWRRELTNLEPGVHRIVLDAPRAPGVYWVRLTQARRSATTRLVVLR